MDGWPKLEKWFTKFGIFQRIDANTSQGTWNNKTVVSSVITPSLSLPPAPFPLLPVLVNFIDSPSCLSRCYDIIIPVVHSSVFYKIVHCCFFVCLEQLYDEVSGLLNETYQKLIAPPEEAPSVSNHLKSFYTHVIFWRILRPY